MQPLKVDPKRFSPQAKTEDTPTSVNDIGSQSINPLNNLKQEIVTLPKDQAELLREANAAKIPPAVLNDPKYTDAENEEILRYIKSGMEKGFELVAKEIGVDPRLLKEFISDPIINEQLPEKLRTKGYCGMYVDELGAIIIDFQSLRSIKSNFHEKFKDLPTDADSPISNFTNVEQVLGILDKQKRALAAISIGAHEALHQARAIARKMLSPTDRSDSNKRKIIAEVRSGRFGTILAPPFHNSISINFVEPPAISSRELRNVLASFVEETLEISTTWVEKKNTAYEEKSYETTVLSQAGIEELKNRLIRCSDFKEFTKQYDNKPDLAFRQLEQYINAMLYKFDYVEDKFSHVQDDILADLPRREINCQIQLTEEGKTKAKEYVEQAVSSVEGNKKTCASLELVSFKDRSIGYALCEEEIAAREIGISCALEKIEEWQEELKTAPQELSTELRKQELEQIKRELEEHRRSNEIGNQLVPLLDELSVAPQDPGILAKINRFKSTRRKIAENELVIKQLLKDLKKVHSTEINHNQDANILLELLEKKEAYNTKVNELYKAAEERCKEEKATVSEQEPKDETTIKQIVVKTNVTLDIPEWLQKIGKDKVDVKGVGLNKFKTLFAHLTDEEKLKVESDVLAQSYKDPEFLELQRAIVEVTSKLNPAKSQQLDKLFKEQSGLVEEFSDLLKDFQPKYMELKNRPLNPDAHAKLLGKITELQNELTGKQSTLSQFSMPYISLSSDDYIPGSITRFLFENNKRFDKSKVKNKPVESS